MEKDNKIVSYRKLSSELKHLVLEQYPYGFEEELEFYQLGNQNKFYAFSLSTPEINYLVKVDVEVDLSITLNEEEYF